MMRIVSRMQKKSPRLRDAILARTLDVSGSWIGREVVWEIFLFSLKGEWDSIANKMVQRFKATGDPVFKSISALSRGIQKKKKGRGTTHFNGDTTNIELLFQTIHSVNQLSIHGAVANWCQQLGLTEEEKGRVNLSVDKNIDNLFRQRHLGTVCEKTN